MSSPTHDFIGIANLPNQRHKIVSRKGAHFTIMVVGESGAGKTTFINTLFAALMREYQNEEKRFQKQLERTVEIEIIRAEIEEKGFNVQLTIIDTPGFGDYVNNSDCWVPIVEFIDEQHLNYMKQERKANRRNIDDMRVHACLYFIQPTGHTLKPLDIEVMKQLGTRVNLIPVIAKADTITRADLTEFKNRILDCIKFHNINVFCPPIESDDEDTTKRNAAIANAMPYSIIGSEQDVVTPDGRRVKGRQYLWGVAEVENEEHCDFKKLRNLLIRTHMDSLISTTEEVHYEDYRANRLTQEGRTDDDPQVRARKLFDAKMKEEEDALRKRFTEQVRTEESKFRKWEQELIDERDRLNKDLEAEHSAVQALKAEIEALKSPAQSRSPRK